MLLTIDVGNSNTVFLIYDGSTHVFEDRMISKKSDALQYYKDAMHRINNEIDEIIISCVVPGVINDIAQACLDVFGFEAKILSGATIKDLVINLDNPLEIGADFIATSIGASYKYGAPVIIADIGSATKLTYTSEKGVFDGGLILPGLGTSLKALTQFIPHLPEVPLILPKKVIGQSTIGAIQSGVMYGLIAQIEGLAHRMEIESGKECVKILTGGYASLIKDGLPNFIHDPSLLNDGLQIISKEGLL